MPKWMIIVLVAFVGLVSYAVYIDANRVDGYVNGRAYHLRDVCVRGHNEVHTAYGVGPGNVTLITTWHCDVSRIDTVYFKVNP
jgi:hypothetical protein